MEETSVQVLRLVLVAGMIGVVIFGGTTLAYLLEGRRPRSTVRALPGRPVRARAGGEDVRDRAA